MIEGIEKKARMFIAEVYDAADDIVCWSELVMWAMFDGRDFWEIRDIGRARNCDGCGKCQLVRDGELRVAFNLARKIGAALRAVKR